MKFFFELGSCWSGAIVTPEAGSTGVRRPTDDHGGYCRSHGRRTSKRLGKVSGAGASADWKPKLNAISENSPMLDAANGGGIRRNAGVDNKKRPVKANPKPKPVSLAEDYWNLSQTMALPAFSPTSYLF